MLPELTGSGANIRVYSNIRAYLDLGYDLELILFTNKKNIEIPKSIEKVRISRIIPKFSEPEIVEKISYIFGYPRRPFLNYLYPIRKIVINEIKKRLIVDKLSIHHFEYVNIASASFGLDGFFVWSNHDLNPERYLSIQNIRSKLNNRPLSITKKFKYFQLKRSEKLVANQTRIMLNISETESLIYKKRIKNIKSRLLPFSWPNEQHIEKKNWNESGVLKMLHLGSLNSMIPFSSLEFIISKLFKIIPNSYHTKIELIVAGHNPDAQFSNYIKKISNKYDNIKLLGYVNNLDKPFAEADIQIVASQFESGLRTRIVESFVRGLPVVSTISAARGLYGLENGENILLGKNELELFDIIKKLIYDKKILKKISKNARELYIAKYSRKVHSELLEKYINNT